MCGRFTYMFSWKQLHHLMQLNLWPGAELTPSFNVAPTQMIPAVRQTPELGREGLLLKWGLIPFWAKDAAIGNRLINARAETVSTLPAFRDAFAKRRCVIPMSGFYEWQASTTSKTKQPYWFSRSDGEPFFVAGLWDHWSHGPEPIESVTAITTTANATLRPVHDRMPVILFGDALARWLDPATGDKSALQQLLAPAPDDLLTSRPVSPRVGNPRNNDPDLLAPLKPTPAPPGLDFPLNSA